MIFEFYINRSQKCSSPDEIARKCAKALHLINELLSDIIFNYSHDVHQFFLNELASMRKCSKCDDARGFKYKNVTS